MKETQSRFRALGNMGDVLIKMEQVEEAIKVYQKQLTLSKQSREKSYEATAYGSLGVCHRLSKQFDKALGYHTQVRNDLTNVNSYETVISKSNILPMINRDIICETLSDVLCCDFINALSYRC